MTVLLHLKSPVTWQPAPVAQAWFCWFPTCSCAAESTQGFAEEAVAPSTKACTAHCLAPGSFLLYVMKSFQKHQF